MFCGPGVFAAREPKARQVTRPAMGQKEVRGLFMLRATRDLGGTPYTCRVGVRRPKIRDKAKFEGF
jgi:hypothetical protein